MVGLYPTVCLNRRAMRIGAGFRHRYFFEELLMSHWKRFVRPLFSFVVLFVCLIAPQAVFADGQTGVAFGKNAP